MYNVRPRKLVYKPPDPRVLEAAKEKRLKEIKMYDIIKEIVLYSIFLWILTMVSYDFRDPMASTMKFHLDKEYALPGSIAGFEKVRII